jgi:hypothetical protein
MIGIYMPYRELLKLLAEAKVFLAVLHKFSGGSSGAPVSCPSAPVLSCKNGIFLPQAVCNLNFNHLFFLNMSNLSLSILKQPINLALLYKEICYISSVLIEERKSVVANAMYFLQIRKLKFRT